MENSIKVTDADPSSIKRYSSCCSSEKSCCHKPDSTSLVSKKLEPSGRYLNQIPDRILNDPELNDAISSLPSNYNFEIHKSVWQIQKNQAKRVALQMPEGFQRYALVISDILVKYGGCEEAVILADVAYGACCVDDFTAVLLGCDMMIHYGHSCLIPITHTKIPVLYVFVEIRITQDPLIANLKNNFTGEKVALLSTVQYVSILHSVRAELEGVIDMFIPQIKPLSAGEVLGCTSPRLPPDTKAMIFIADGRFHLEAAMIANPSIPAYRYDPFTKCVFEEEYDHLLMLKTRRRMIEVAKSAKNFGVILGTLGRQGSPAVLSDLTNKLERAGKSVLVVLMSEVRPEKLAEFPQIEAWVQTSCPRLSIDWNYTFGEQKPLLTPYELNVTLGEAKAQWICNDKVENVEVDGSYPMDFYATGDAALISGPWTPGYQLRPPRHK